MASDSYFQFDDHNNYIYILYTHTDTDAVGVDATW